MIQIIWVGSYNKTGEWSRAGEWNKEGKWNRRGKWGRGRRGRGRGRRGRKGRKGRKGGDEVETSGEETEVAEEEGNDLVFCITNENI